MSAVEIAPDSDVERSLQRESQTDRQPVDRPRRHALQPPPVEHPTKLQVVVALAVVYDDEAASAVVHHERLLSTRGVQHGESRVPELAPGGAPALRVVRSTMRQLADHWTYDALGAQVPAPRNKAGDAAHSRSPGLGRSRCAQALGDGPAQQNCGAEENRESGPQPIGHRKMTAHGQGNGAAPYGSPYGPADHLG